MIPVNILMLVYVLGIVLLLCQACITKKDVPLAALFTWVLAGFPIVANLNFPRDLDYSALLTSTVTDEWPFELLLLARLSNVILIVMLAIVVLRKIKGAVPRNGLWLLLSFFLIPLSSILSSLFGTSQSVLDFSLLRPIYIMSLGFFIANEYGALLVHHIKSWCFVYVIGSMLAVVLIPEFSVLRDDPNSYLNGTRLYGISSHPNALGPIAFLYLALDFFIDKPSRFKLIKRALAFCVVVWAQSKGIWFVALVAAAIYMLFRFEPQGTAINDLSNVAYRIRKRSFLILSILFIASSALAGFLLFFSPTLPKNVVTLTGRVELWAATLAQWGVNPVFGYGPGLWDDAFRYSYFREDNVYAGHAHNMFIQALGATGLIGFFSLLFYVFAQYKIAVNSYLRFSGLSLVIFVFMLGRCITESPFRTTNLDESMFVNLAVFAILIHLNSKTNAASACHSSGVLPCP